ncbi:Abi-alpha family protein [Mycolicibacterium gilvum]|uniref:Abi-alpha family protein n=1 Tax=Mycolicibacterium gilvum TaxID=1804 RepID=UPI004045C113
MPNPYDPRGLINHAIGAARTGLDVYSWTEKQVVGALRHGLEALDPKNADAHTDPAAPPESDSSLNSKLAQLLGRALDQNTRGSRVELYHHLLDQLVADEARIVGALSDGSSSPLVNVYGWMQTRGPRRAVLENASLVGRVANVALPEMVSQYVSHLLSLGLVEIGPEDPELSADYEVLLAESAVLAAIKNATRGPMPARIEKYTLSLSPLGESLWQAAAEGFDRG